MSGITSRMVDWAMRNRSKMPQFMQDAMTSAARNPDGVIGQLSAKLLGSGEPPAPTAVPDAAVRVYIAPTNYSGQGFAWARALERADPQIAARNAAIALPGGFAFTADTLVPIAVVNTSASWAESEWQVASQFTHVLVEAERPLFGKRFGRDLRAEVRALDAAGASVAFLCHGTDIRNPDHHATLTPWSPYPQDPRTAQLRDDAQDNLALLEEMGRPVFVSTPDLIADVPWATWCPVVVDVERFAAETPAFAGSGVPRIIHASSNVIQKGSDHIEPALAPILAAGAAEYELITATPAAKMPAVFAASDIVLDQFRAGSYGVAACEAMCAGRVVVGHVLPFVREHVLRVTGLELPIVEATPDTLNTVISELISDPDRARVIASSGPEFVRKVHSGAMSAEALIDNWIKR